MSRAIYNNQQNGGSNVQAASRKGRNMGALVGCVALGALALSGGLPLLAADLMFANMVAGMFLGSVAGGITGSVALGGATRLSNWTSGSPEVVDHPRAMQAHRTDPVNAKAIDSNKFAARAGKKAPRTRVQQVQRPENPYLSSNPRLYDAPAAQPER